jgi:hypothetical protein
LENINEYDAIFLTLRVIVGLNDSRKASVVTQSQFALYNILKINQKSLKKLALRPNISLTCSLIGKLHENKEYMAHFLPQPYSVLLTSTNMPKLLFELGYSH